MVKICDLHTFHSSLNDFSEFIQNYSFPLHNFQKWAIEGILTGNDVLVTAPTGSGKSLPAEFAINYFHKKGKKTIYCSPIKALSNQKFYDFSKKFPEISFGLITGDIKTNPGGDVLIMTTEILLNKLYQLFNKDYNSNISISFDMDIENELGCVVFDEIHMINDKARGHVWENSILFMPNHIQIIGLSATLDNPEGFAFWIENKGNKKIEKNEKIVYLSKKIKRTVPLTHYGYFCYNQNVIKTIKDKATQKEIKDISNELHLLQTADGILQENYLQKIKSIQSLFSKHKLRMPRQFVLNQVAKHLYQKDMLPALCYVFSRKQVEICAGEITCNLIEEGNNMIHIVAKECNHIIRKLPNYQEYLDLPEFKKLISLLEKGIAIHHSGMLPILREIVELLFEKGYIKLLFCTESVAIGLNLPVKTTIFTDIQKHDGEFFRVLEGHEFVQASGRAGRLGIDKVGNVVHLFNLFRSYENSEYKNMLKGAPQKLESKFKISYNLVLNILKSGNNILLYNLSQKSMLSSDIDGALSHYNKKLNESENKLDIFMNQKDYLITNENVICEYFDLKKGINNLRNKQRKYADKKIKVLEQTISNTVGYNFNMLQSNFDKYQVLKKELNIVKSEIYELDNRIDKKIKEVMCLLLSTNLIQINSDTSIMQEYILTENGVIASLIREMPCYLFSNNSLMCNLRKLNSIELAMIFSMFTNISINEELLLVNPNTNNEIVNKFAKLINDKFIEFNQLESIYNIDNEDTKIVYDIMEYVSEWCLCESDEECVDVKNRLLQEKNIYLGEFSKALLKIVNISNEMERIAELLEDMEFLKNVKNIPNLLLKSVVTNQSLYI